MPIRKEYPVTIPEDVAADLRDKPLPEHQRAKAKDLLARLRDGEDVQTLVGEWFTPSPGEHTYTLAERMSHLTMMADILELAQKAGANVGVSGPQLTYMLMVEVWREAAKQNLDIWVAGRKFFEAMLEASIGEGA